MPMKNEMGMFLYVLYILNVIRYFVGSRLSKILTIILNTLNISFSFCFFFFRSQRIRRNNKIVLELLGTFWASIRKVSS